MEEYRKEIRQIAVERKIEGLLHFTQRKNIPGIVEYGLMSRQLQIELQHFGTPSAPDLLSNAPDAISLSISRTNEGMFASKRDDSGHQDWVILALKPEILWTHNCVFCWTNAGKNAIREHRGFRGGPWAFKLMFSDSDGARGDLADCFPTSSAAEVQVARHIAPKYIFGALVERPEAAEFVQKALDTLPGAQRRVVVGSFKDFA